VIREPERRRWVPQERWAREEVASVPAFVAREMLLRHGELVGTVGPHSTSPWFVANQYLVETRLELQRSRLSDAFDEEAVRGHAENYARICAEMPQLAEREWFAIRRGVEPPPAKFLSDGYEARAKRLADPVWWRRKLRAVWTRSAEEGIRRVGLVRKGKAPYASDPAVNHRAGQKRRMRAYLEAHVATNEIGEQLGLFDVQQGSVANPTLRRGEFMTRVRGFEELGQFRRDEVLFFTLTTPSRFHPQLATGGRNPRYDPVETVRSAQQWLCKMWARFRASLHRRKVLAYGFRIAEPHHDGTPHWHGLLFCRPVDVAFVERELRAKWLADSGDDPGAGEHRVQTQRIDASKGSAAGYIAKYVAKNIDGAGTIGGQESDESGVSVNNSVVRVDAWASIHGIRQFQQFGGPPVGLWREARRAREEEFETADIDIARCCRAADRGSWYQFCRSVTFDTGTRRSILKFWKEETGEMSKYGEPRGARVVGLKVCSARLITRPHRWKIERKGRGDRRHDGSLTKATNVGGSGSSSESPLGPVAITIRDDPPTIPGTGRWLQGRWAEMTLDRQNYPFGWVFLDHKAPGPPPEKRKSDHRLQ
jgi:hypothetical protein